MKKKLKKLIQKMMINSYIRRGYEYFTISEGNKIVAIHFYRGV